VVAECGYVPIKCYSERTYEAIHKVVIECGFEDISKVVIERGFEDKDKG
jgi:hypothetical protein